VEIVNDKHFAVSDHIVLVFFALIFLSLAFYVRKNGEKFEVQPLNNKWMNSISLYMATYGGVAVWFLPLSAFAFGANLLMPYVISATVFLFVAQFVVRKSFKKNCNCIYPSNKFCTSVSILSLLLRMLAWLLLPAYIIAQSTGLQWEYVVFIVGLIPFVSCFIGDRKTSHLLDALQFFIIAVIVIVCICLLGVKIDGLPSLEMSLDDVTSMPFAVICLCLLPILSVDRVVVSRVMINVQNAENEIKKTILGGYLLSFIGCVVLCLLGVLIHNYYKGNVSVFPIHIQDLSMLLPSSAINELPTGFAGLMIAALFCLSWCALCRQSSAIVSYFVNENATTGAEYDKRIFKTKALVLLLTYLLLFSIAFLPGVGQFVKTLISL
jgi:Na+/proline symporter